MSEHDWPGRERLGEIRVEADIGGLCRKSALELLDALEVLEAQNQAMASEVYALRAERDAAVAERDQKIRDKNAMRWELKQARAEAARYREALEHIVEHLDLVGGPFAQKTGTYHIARAALGKSTTPSSNITDAPHKRCLCCYDGCHELGCRCLDAEPAGGEE